MILITMAAIRAATARGLAWATSPLGGVILSAVAVLGLLGGFYGFGHHEGVKDERSVWVAKAARDAKTVEKRTAAAGTISAVAQATHETRADAISVHTKTLIKKVPYYVTVQDDAKCTVPAGAVGLYNASVSGDAAFPESASGHDEATPAVPLSAVIATSVENIGIGMQWKEEALTWRQWYVDQSKAWGLRGPK